MKFEIGVFERRGRMKGCVYFQAGYDGTGVRARSLGLYSINRTTILTPVNDRFPAQAFDLKLRALQNQKGWHWDF